MKKILVVITTGFVPYGGLTTVMMNYYRAMDKEGLQIDFASTNEPPAELLEELHKHGSRYFRLGERKKDMIRYLSRLSHVLKDNRYDVIHVNGNSATMALELMLAKQTGIPVRIAHGHTSQGKHIFVHRSLQRIFQKSYTHGIAVSDKAGEWLFGNGKYQVLNNAIFADRYQYDADIRKKYRQKLGLDNKFVVGHVGKLYEVKNHTFLIDVFYELQKKQKNAYLLLVGGGKLRQELEKKCRELGIREHVAFLGMRNDIPQLLQAMDVFVFPSLYEGMPNAVLEAQASGLPLLISDVITKSVKCTERTYYKSLSDGTSGWAKEILKLSKMDYDRKTDTAAQIREKGFDVEECAVKLREIYLNPH